MYRHLSAAALGLCLLPAVAAGQGARKSTVTSVRARAHRAARRGDLAAAAVHYGRLAFAGDRAARRKLDSLKKRRIRDLLERARGVEGEQELALLQRAFALDPFSPGQRSRLSRLFKRHDYAYYQGSFRPKKRVEALRAAEGEALSTRRSELRLPARFRGVRRGLLRFHTDVDPRYGKRVIAQMLAAIQAHVRAYMKMFAPLGLRHPGGLDVVLFDSEADYVRHTRSTGTAGLYVPRKGCAYFYAGRAGFNFDTLLHEMTHQLNDKMLGAMFAAPWFEEGIAEYFGAGKLSRGCTRLQLGPVEADRLDTFRGMVAGGGSPYPLAAFLDASSNLSSAYSAQAWAIVHFLLEAGLPAGRMIVFDLVRGARATGKRQASLGRAAVEAVFKRYGWTLPRFERVYLAYYRNNCRLGG